MAAAGIASSADFLTRVARQSSLPPMGEQRRPRRLRLRQRCASADNSGHPRSPDVVRMAAYRYARLQRQIAAHGCAAALLCSPMNVRYATETRYASITNMHSPTRAVFVPAEGAAVLYDSATPRADSPADFIAETRDSPITAYFVAGAAYADRTRRWAAEVAALVRGCAGRCRRLAIDSAEPELLVALQGAGLDVVNAEPLVERAAAVKSEDELCCIAASVAVAEAKRRDGDVVLVTSDTRDLGILLAMLSVGARVVGV